MSFAAGVAQQLSERDKNMLASEELNQRKKDRLLNFASKFSTKGGLTKGKGSSNVKLELKKLMAMGADPKLVAKVGGYDPASVVNIVGKLTDIYDKRKIGAAELTPQAINDYLSNIVTVTIPGEEPDFEKIKKMGISDEDLDQEIYSGFTLRNLLTEQLTTKDGTFATMLPNRTDRLDSNQIEKVINRADKKLFDVLSEKEVDLMSEKTDLQKQINNADSSSKPNLQAQLNDLNKELSLYSQAVDANKTTGNRSKAVELVGGQVIIGLIQENPAMLFQYDWGVYQPYVEKYIFASKEEAQQALDQGIIKETDYINIADVIKRAGRG